jgi:hypothetical protein
VPVPPVPVLDESGELILVPAPTPAMLRDQAVAALKAPPAHYQAPASRGGARSTYSAEPPPHPSRRPGPARPPGSVTTSPSTYLPNTGPTPTAPWRQQPAPPTWLPQLPGQPQPGQAQRGPGQRSAPPPLTRPAASAPITYRASGRTPGSARTGGRRPGSSKGWIPGLIILAFIVLANVVPHLNGVFHRGVPAGVDKSVNSYYTDLERGDATQAGQLICTSDRVDWLRSGSTSDLNLHPTAHTITSTKSAGHSWHVVVDIVAPGRHNATITVVHEAGAYRLCGGTGP